MLLDFFSTSSEGGVFGYLFGSLAVIMFSNNPAAARANPDFQVDLNIAERVIAYILQLIQQGIISEEQITRSYKCVWERTNNVEPSLR